MNLLSASFSAHDNPQLPIPRRILSTEALTEPGRATLAARCAFVGIEVRAALEDRFPRLAALAASWFDDAHGDDDDLPPHDAVCLRVNLEAFAATLARRDGLPATVADAAAWLSVAGFDQVGDMWIGDRADLRLIGTQGIERVVSAPANTHAASD